MSEAATAELEETAAEAEPEQPAPEAPAEPEVPIPAMPQETVLVTALWLPSQSRRRLLDADVELLDEGDDRAQLVLASTRGPAARRASVSSYVEAGVPVVVVCHPGGEDAAIEFLSLGAVTVVAEGTEASAMRQLTGETSDHLVEVFRSEIDRSWTGSAGGVSIDPVTQLPTAAGLEAWLAEINKDGQIPRLVIVELGPPPAMRMLGPVGHDALRRRLSVGIAELVALRGGEVFDVGDDRLALVFSFLSAEDTARLGDQIVDFGAAFVPTGEPLRVVVGSAGPDNSSDVATLRLLADRALDAARTRTHPVLDAAELTQHSAATVELTTATRLADAVDGFDPAGDHSSRVSEYARDIARELHLEGIDIARVGLAARLHDIGKIVYGERAFDPTSPDYDTANTSHPEWGEHFVRSMAGPEVAAMIRSHHERWDGAGYPDALVGADIPMGARVIAVADLYDRLAVEDMKPIEIEERLRSEAGGALDPELVEAALALFGRG